MKREELLKLLSASKTWQKDRYGHYQTEEIVGGTCRLKIQATSVRFERKAWIVDKNEWINIASDYFKNVEVKDGAIKIQTKRVPIK